MLCRELDYTFIFLFSNSFYFSFTYFFFYTLFQKLIVCAVSASALHGAYDTATIIFTMFRLLFESAPSADIRSQLTLIDAHYHYCVIVESHYAHM